MARRPEQASDRFTTVRSIIASLPMDNIDTDQIIPARFLKITDKAGLGGHVFEDLRRTPDGTLRADFALNRADRMGAAILVTGDNFGCGSSREHAAWALAGAGIRVVVSTSFADIFRGNALKNGILPVVLSAAEVGRLAGLGRSDTAVTVDLKSQEVLWPDGKASFRIDPFARTCLLEGVDELGYILAHDSAITAFELNRKGRAGA
ncbi:MAG TPA: 3-isopropylmalate dehydratase small subunit [Bacteroidota bacterium]|nr:3-isopropylmalate dehydratase small subunit [Bacteroidota bacterium]